MESILSLNIGTPAVNQCSLYLGFHDDETISYCKSKSITYEAYGALRVSTRARLPPVLYHPFHLRLHGLLAGCNCSSRCSCHVIYIYVCACERERVCVCVFVCLCLCLCVFICFFSFLFFNRFSFLFVPFYNAKDVDLTGTVITKIASSHQVSHPLSIPPSRYRLCIFLSACVWVGVLVYVWCGCVCANLFTLGCGGNRR